MTRGLAEALHDLAKPAPDQQQQDDFGDEDDFFGAADAIAGASAASLSGDSSQGGSGAQNKRRAQGNGKDNFFHGMDSGMPPVPDENVPR